MILYHGTSAKYLDSILKDGIQPRNKTGNSNYSGELVSKENLVYLTKSFPFTYAYSVPEVRDNDGDLLILQVRVEDNKLFPDEDFVERMYFIAGKKKKMTEINPRDYQDVTRDSIKYMRSACIEEVRPDQIVSYKVLPASDHNLHCGLGAQGNDRLSEDELKNQLNVLDPNKVAKYEKRLKMLFKQGWNKVKKEIMKENPSSVIECSVAGKIELNNGKVKSVILQPNKDLSVYICNEWANRGEVFDDRLKDFVQVHPSQVSRVLC